MNKLNIKLQSKRGASIMLALLLFLVCILAGVAALTAASANMGRHSYMRETQQKYLAVSSAAKLIREQLNGMELTCEYTYNPISAYDDTFEKFIVTSGTLVKGTISCNVDYTNDHLAALFNEDLEKMVYDAFYTAVKGYSNSELDPNVIMWKNGVTVSTPETITTTFEFTVECDDIDTNGKDVEAVIEILNGKEPYSSGSKTFTLTVSCDTYVISTEGTIEISALAPSDILGEDFHEDEETGVQVLYPIIESSKQKTTIKFVIDDAFVRK